MALGRKLQLLTGLLRALPGEFIAARQAIAYRHLLAKQYPLAKFGQNCIVGGDCRFDEGVTVGARTTLVHCKVGRYSYIGPDSQYQHCAIGSFCSLGPQVLLGLGRHPTQHISTHPAFFSVNHPVSRIAYATTEMYEGHLPIIIGSDVWIGARVMVLDGITVGNGAILAAGAIVTKDVEPYTIVAGVPARPLRKRFDDHAIQHLLEVAWWDKPTDWLAAHSSFFTDIGDFVDATVVR